MKKKPNNVPRNVTAMLMITNRTGTTKVMRDRRNRRSKDAKNHFSKEMW